MGFFDGLVGGLSQGIGDPMQQRMERLRYQMMLQEIQRRNADERNMGQLMFGAAGARNRQPAHA